LVGVLDGYALLLHASAPRARRTGALAFSSPDRGALTFSPTFPQYDLPAAAAGVIAREDPVEVRAAVLYEARPGSACPDPIVR
jgi:hypothetical protein